MENNLAQRKQKSIDRMRKKMLLNKGERKICLVLLIEDDKNDIDKFLNSLKTVINTISLINVKSENKDEIISWCKKNNIPLKINNNEYNLTQSIKISKIEFPDTDYFLVSNLNENWEVKNFDKKNLIDDRYEVLKKDNESYYPETRLLSSKINWVFKLGVFGYWINGKDEHPKNIKNNLLTSLKVVPNTNIDNYERNVKLLFDDLNNPALTKNDKLTVKFYLAKIFKDNDKFEDAIYYSNERINGGGWDEEIYCSIYNIGMVYEKWGCKMKECFNNENIEFTKKWNDKNLTPMELLRKSASFFAEAIAHYKKAYEYRPTRSESLYSIVKLCRIIETNEMTKIGYETSLIGNKIKFPRDKLYVRSECYDYLFDFEIAMISHLIPEKKENGAIIIDSLLNREDIPEDIKTQLRNKIKNYV